MLKVNFRHIGIGLNLTALVTGVVMSVIYVLLELKKRSERKKYNFRTTPTFLFIIQAILVIGAINLFAFWLAAYKGIPIIFAIIGGLILMYSVFAANTAPGRYIYAMGGNEKAARLSGIKVNKMLFLVYVNMAVLSAIAGISFASRLNAV